MAELARVCEYDEGSTNGTVDEELKAEQVENRKHKHRFLKYTITAGIKIASRPVSYLAIQSSTPTCICLFLMQTHTQSTHMTTPEQSKGQTSAQQSIYPDISRQNYPL